MGIFLGQQRPVSAPSWFLYFEWSPPLHTILTEFLTYHLDVFDKSLIKQDTDKSAEIPWLLLIHPFFHLRPSSVVSGAMEKLQPRQRLRVSCARISPRPRENSNMFCDSNFRESICGGRVASWWVVSHERWENWLNWWEPTWETGGTSKWTGFWSGSRETFRSRSELFSNHCQSQMRHVAWCTHLQYEFSLLVNVS